MPRLARIAIYPFKSLDPLFLDSARILASGAIENDRRFALRDESHTYVNGKRNALVHRLRTNFDPQSRLLKLTVDGTNESGSFDVENDREILEEWLSTYFDVPITIVEDTVGGFPDDLEAPGPTFISTATLETVASWYEGLSLDEARLRFRANLEIDGVEPFWEDRLYAAPGQVVRFSLGSALFEGTNPCARCVVPSRSPITGTGDTLFQKTFATKRKDQLPSWAEPSRFDHFYRLAVNTRPVTSSLPTTIHVGDELKIEGPLPL